MLEQDEKLKMRFDFYKSLFIFLLIFLVGMIVILVSTNLNVIKSISGAVIIIALSVALFKLYKEIRKSYKK